ncbi:MAG: low molecular weight phosphotyrosine protein phosphatase [Chthonomonas sp.]|nr:low molecular weight phosphotyrosine protein phosphatase [Chthonomonas sp.]
MPIRVLFVCTGNICRSPLAEAMFRKYAEEAGASDLFEIDSAGTGGWHAGELADPRTLAVARALGCPTSHRARQVRPTDFEEFDHMVLMDHQNIRDLKRLGTGTAEFSLMLSWDPKSTREEVPDPYYGGPEGFSEMAAMLEPACRGLLQILTPRGTI